MSARNIHNSINIGKSNQLNMQNTEAYYLIVLLNRPTHFVTFCWFACCYRVAIIFLVNEDFWKL